MSLADLFQKLDNTLSNWQSQSGSTFNSLNDLIRNLSQKFTKPVGPGQQGPPAPPTSAFGKMLFDFMQSGSLKDKIDTVGGISKSLGFGGVAGVAQTASNVMGSLAGNPESMLGLVKDIVDINKKLMTHLPRAGEHFRQGIFTSNKAEQLGTHAFGMMEEFGKALGPLGIGFKAFGQLGKTVFESIERLRMWNEELYKGNIEFAKFSASMSAVEARQTARDIIFSKDRGDARAATAELQAQAKHEFNQRLAPIEDAMANFQNKLSAAMNIVNTKILDTLTFGLLKPQQNQGFTPLDDTQQNIDYVENLFKNYAVPPRFKRP